MKLVLASKNAKKLVEMTRIPLLRAGRSRIDVYA